MLCEAPKWVVHLFEWLEDKLITGDMFNNAINWLIDKGIIICNELII